MGPSVGALLLLSLASSVPTTVRSLQASVSSSWLPGSSLSLVLLPFTVEELGRVEELSFLYLAQVLYLLQGPGLPRVHQLDPATGEKVEPA